MRIGASIWPFRWDVPYEKAISRIADLGFKAVELIAWNEEILNGYYTPKRTGELKKIIRDKGLVLSQFVSTPSGMAHPDKKVRDQAVEYFKMALDVCVDLEAELFNGLPDTPFSAPGPQLPARPHVQKFQVHTPNNDPDAWKRNWDNYVETMRHCMALCEAADLRYALEPHPYSYVFNVGSMLRLIEHVDSQALGVNFDPSHLFPMGEVPHVAIYQLGDRIFHAHFSDNDGVTNAHWRPGKGKIDWTAVIQALKDIEFDGVISMELENVPGVSISKTEGPSYASTDATAEFAAENIKAIKYIQSICKQLGVEFD
ncbi:MAG: sugar phosphate isomerase/epimerase [Firmicutes bacterium]|nr:sugar phosphate isomerase/epimerase [Bacillota bacterium]